MTRCTAPHGSRMMSSRLQPDVAISTKRMEILLNTERKIGTVFMAEITGIASGIVQEIMMTSSASNGAVVMVIECYRQ